MSTAGKKYAVVVVISITIVLLLAATKAILDVWFGLMALTVLLALGWIVSILPDEMIRTKKAVIVLISVVSLYVFILPAFIRILMPEDVQRAWKTSSIGRSTKLATWLYDPDARARHNLEELCRVENKRLTSGHKDSEIGRTMGEIRKLVETHGAKLEVLTNIRTYPKNMTLDELLAMQKSEKAVDQYHAWQGILQIQRNNARAKYDWCMGEIPKPDGQQSGTGAGDKKVVDSLTTLKKKLPNITWKEIWGDTVPTLFSLAGIFLVLGIVSAFMWFNKTSNLFWRLAVVSAFAGFVVHVINKM
ncbi:MAG: hypothetical protein G01um101448_951 [Parcubacteria group bacterium Gr01-1014_48]|nr:MAG: hypothetical protein Greene041614_1038 [Parcubacteria group bacterium Greene0416_14]TSC72552.1 MAG: hypothetical protein G01um101448_951 [Parcubacteria group bacterium Gr01-1014_48]TSD01335.1 MAG: hypothetical protein Greene101415_349 [Parcubacteria group bacterium Greene1014_15]TSD08023.1 MAG: hypothetical protein Greene07144_511 [Parcubacteria group bacterium Greene0714_4]